MALVEIPFGGMLKSVDINANFEYLEEQITISASALQNEINAASNNVTSLGNTVNTLTSTVNTNNTSLQNEINAIKTNASGLSNTSLSNINATGKANIARYSKPNYSAGISKAWNTQYTAETNGWIRAACTCGTQNRNHWWYLYINGIAFKFHNNQGDWDVDGDSILLPIAKGQTYKATEGQDWKELTFYPDLT